MDEVELVHAGAAEQARLIRTREISARELVTATLAQIDRVDPRLNAYRIVLADHALQTAALLDEGSAVDLPLRGVPVAIKDDTDVAGQVTAWGTDAHGPARTEDATVVARLRAAGAIVIGKTNVPEMTIWPWTASTTWGVTRNPWDPARTCGGSSGGSAVAAATGMCGLAHGSDGGGSIRYPATLTGLFGLKTGRGRIPLDPPHHDAWNGLIAYGPLARHVADAALYLDATADHAPPAGYAAALAAPPPKLRIAVSYDPPPGMLGKLSPDRREAVEATADLLRALGHQVFERQVDFGFGAAWNTSIRFLAGVHSDVATMARPSRLERTTRGVARLGGWLPARTLRSARAAEPALALRLNQVFAGADLVLTPAAAGPPPSIADTDRGTLRSLRQSNVTAWTAPWNAVGQPAASVPAGFDVNGLPLAVQLVARPQDEVTILRVAAQLEEIRPWAQQVPSSA